jgi:hypothetical protein
MMAYKEYFEYNAWQWESDADLIKYTIRHFKKPLIAQNFDDLYHQEMDGIDRFIVGPTPLNWETFVSALKNQCLLSLEGLEAKKQMDAGKYSGDIEDYIVKMKRLKNLVGMLGVILRTTIKRQLLKDLYRTISLIPFTYLDDKWIQMVVKAKKLEESFLAEEKLLKCHQEKP